MLYVTTSADVTITYPITYSYAAFPLLQTAWGGNQSVILRNNNLNSSFWIGNVGKGTWICLGY